MIASPFENEYFAREDAELIRKLAWRLRRQLQEEERERTQALHWMHCPHCGSELHQVFLRGALADVCLGCHGVFLDERELPHLAKPSHAGVMSGILNWFRPELKL